MMIKSGKSLLNTLIPSDFMIDVSAVFPALTECYPRYAVRVLEGFCYTRIQLVEKGNHKVCRLRLVSQSPCMYGQTPYDKDIELTWSRTPIQKLLFACMHKTGGPKTLHAFCIVPLRK